MKFIRKVTSTIFATVGLSVCLIASTPLETKAAVFTVDTLSDSENNGCTLGACTLREAIAAANFLPDADTIVFKSGMGGKIALTNGQLEVSNSVTINGPGARILSVSGNNSSRVFLISGDGTTANINKLRITEGNTQLLGTLLGDGGGILNTGGATLNLVDSTVSGNTAISTGGGIATRAVLLNSTTTHIIRSTISGNTATAGGGGISNLGTGGLISSAVTKVDNSTISNNNALAEGGGISNVAGTLNLTHDTISHNTSAIAGGGVVNVAGVLVGFVNVRNTILAQNNSIVGTDLISSDGLGIFNSMGNNLVGNNLDVEASFAASAVLDVTAITPNAKADLVGSVSVGYRIIDPLLGALQNNGGQNDTRAITSSSPAADNGHNCVVANSCGDNLHALSLPLVTDQRGAGYSRIRDSDSDSDAIAETDIGAYEIQSVTTAATADVSGRIVTETGRAFRSAAVVTITGANGISKLVLAPKGSFSISDIPTGETYVITAFSKFGQFEQQVKVVNVTGDTNNIVFVANDSSSQSLETLNR